MREEDKKRYKEWQALPEVRLPNGKISDEFRDVLLLKGLIEKSDMEVGTYYLGKSRNAMVAMWTGQFFLYMRDKAKSIYPDAILHIDDDPGRWDLFVPFKKVEPYPEEILKGDIESPSKRMKVLFGDTLDGGAKATLQIPYEKKDINIGHDLSLLFTYFKM